MMDGVTNDTNSTECYPTSREINIIMWTSLSCGIVSLISCIFIIFVIILFCKYRSTTQRVILYLTITIALLSIVYILHGAKGGPLEDKDPYCIITGFLDQITGWMEVTAICCLTFDLFVKVVFLKFNTERYEWAYLVLIFIFPFLVNWIPFINSAYGVAGAYCWIREYEIGNCTERDEYPLVLRFVLYWIPTYIALTLIFIAYTFARIKAHRRLKAYSGKFDHVEQTTRELLVREVRLYQFYPLIFAVIFSVAFIPRVAEAVDTNRSFFVLRLIHVIFISLQGPVIATVFLLDYDTRHHLFNLNSIKVALFDWCCCCRKRKMKEYVIITDQKSTDSFNRSMLNKMAESHMENNDNDTINIIAADLH